MGVLIDWLNGRGFVNSDHIVSAKCHIDQGQIKLYVKDITGHEHLIQDPSNINEFEYRLDWEKEGRRQIVALKRLIQGDRPQTETKPIGTEAPESKKVIERKAK